MYYYLLWCGPKEGFHLGPSVLLHSEEIPEADFQSWVAEAIEAGATSMPTLLENLTKKHGFVKPEFAGFTYVEFAAR